MESSIRPTGRDKQLGSIGPAAKPAASQLAGQEEEPVVILDEQEEAISLVEETSEPAKGSSLRTFGGGAAKMDAKVALNRPVNADGKGATRCRLFYSKIAVSSLVHMENQINEWLDGGSFEVKYVGQCIGVMEGKTAEPNLLVTVWY